MKLLLVTLLSYLLGSIPFSQIFAKLKGKDVRAAGTKNVGATNALVVAGPLVGALSLLGDVAKGIVAVSLARYFAVTDVGIALSALAVIAGHDFSVFLGFKGGKGVATTFGVLLALDPIFAVLVLFLWILCLVVVRYFIPSTILVLCFLPVMMWMASWRGEYVLFGVANALLGIYAHRNDLKRYFSGQELTIQESLKKYRGSR
jgi:glycerol-3-phosphate acyltransferase PlsY